VALAARKPQDDAEICEVWEENWPVVELFMGLGTQWAVLAGFGASMHMGLPSTAIEAELRMRRVKNRAQVLDDLRAMERAALPILNQKNDAGDADTLNE
jgi:hypothetical protein